MSEAEPPYTGKVKNAGKRKGMSGWMKTALAIAVSVIILGFYFKDIEWPKFFEALEQANLWMAFFSIVISQLVFWLFGVFQTERTFNWFHKPFDWVNYMWVRGGLYLLVMVNTGLGGAGNIIYLQQKTHISWMKFISIAFFRTSVQAAAIGFALVPLTLLLHWYDIFKLLPLNPWIWWCVLIVGLLAFWDGWFFFLKNRAIGLSRYFFTKGEKRGALVGGIRNKAHPFWEIFRVATQAQWLWLMLWVYVPVLSTIICYWYFAKAFNIEIPFLLFAATILLVLMIQDTPLAFAGFGSTTLAWSLFYGEYASLEAIASLSLCMPLLRLLMRGAVGVVSIRPAISDINSIIEEQRRRNFS